ncbi:MAG: hypothetical protein ABI229_11520 [Gemmatimonadaceae bacterium]
MSDVLVQFDEPQLSADGRMFIAQILASRLQTGLWEAWIEFHPRIGGDPVRTRSETEQLSRGDLRFWAAGVTREHLKDALSRALAPAEPTSPHGGTRSEATARGSGEQAVLETNRLRNDDPVLDPMAAYRNSGEYTLRHELRSLDAQQLSDIIAKFGIAEMDVTDLARTYEDALAERIVADVQHNVDKSETHHPARENRISE